MSEKISFTESEVAELTGLKVKTLQRWRFLNQGPRFVRLGRCVRYPAESLLHWINSQPGGGDEAEPVKVSDRGEGSSR
jgi:predicted DNA-binding transcriptional regulator AlpA